ncbi:MAG: ATP-binding protein [Parcubacteria group bacterium]|jgi:hypothetical protein
MEPLRFDISLTVLNHLGRNLYRSFATILGEAISNAWDAEAENVQIAYNPEKHSMCIVDDGFGMNRDDLQNKFLNIGYSKRDKLGLRSPVKKRHHIGRKGIGKLALLSCAEQVVILSKVVGGEWVGVVIDNSEINQEIKNGKGVANYELKEPDLAVYKELCVGEKGTVICFEGLKEEQSHTEEFLQKIIALYFRFSLMDPEFKIFLNNNKEEISVSALSELANKTQFIWNINDYDSDPYLEMIKPACEAIALATDSVEIRGFIASVKKPTNRNIFGAKERIGVDLFVNGRMRELDILKHLPSSQVPEEYLYGQIHINSLDSDEETDRFTSSREGVQADDPTYKKYLGEIKSLVSKIMDQWDDLRDRFGDDGDPNNTKRESSRIKKAKSLYREVAKDYVSEDGGGSKNDKFFKDLANDAAFNSSSYVQCFVAENLLRRHIGSAPTVCSNIDLTGKTCTDRYDTKTGSISLCEYCKGERGKQSLQQQKGEAGTSIQIRSAEENLLMYLDYMDLAKIIDSKILKDEDKPYKPLRNSVMHTSRLTEEAKTKLTSVFDNVVATVKQLIG